MLFFNFHLLIYAIFGYFLIKRNKINYFNVSIILFFFYGIIFIYFPYYENNSSIYLDDKFFIGMIFSLIFFAFSLLLIKPKIQNYRFKIKNNIILKYSSAIIIFYLVFIVGEIIYLAMDCGIISLITKDRSGNLLQNYYDKNTFLSTLDFFFTPFILLLLGKDRNNKKLVIVTLLLISFCNFLTESHRTAVALPVLVLLFYINFYIKKVNVIYLAVFCVLLLLFFSFFQYVRKGMVYDINSYNNTVSLKHGMSGLGTVTTFYDMYLQHESGYLKYEFGKQLWYYNIIMFVPRFLWKDKPTISFSARMTEIIYGQIGVGNKSWVRTFTVWGEGFSQFGWAGMILYSILLVFLMRSVIFFLSRYEGSEFLCFYYLAQSPLLLRADLFSIYSRSVVLIIFILIAHMFFYRKKKVFVDNSILIKINK